MLNDMGTDNWMDDVEVLNKGIQPAIGIARLLIEDARFEIPHMPKMPKNGHRTQQADDLSGKASSRRNTLN